MEPVSVICSLLSNMFNVVYYVFVFFAGIFGMYISYAFFEIQFTKKGRMQMENIQKMREQHEMQIIEQQMTDSSKMKDNPCEEEHADTSSQSSESETDELNRVDVRNSGVNQVVEKDETNNLEIDTKKTQ